MTLKTILGEIHILTGLSLLLNGHGVGGSHRHCAQSMQMSLTFQKQAYGAFCPQGGGVPPLPLGVSGSDVARLGRCRVVSMLETVPAPSGGAQRQPES